MAFALRRPMARRTASDRLAVEDANAGNSAPPRRAGTARVAAARGAWAVGSTMTLIARIIRTIAGLIAALIVAAIVLRVLGANAGNTVVRDIHDAAKFFVGPFNGMFSIHNAKLAMAVNWGIAAAVYVAVGWIIAGVIARLAPAGVAPSQPVV